MTHEAIETLLVARDAELCGRPEIAAALRSEVEVDAVHVRVTVRRRASRWMRDRRASFSDWSPGEIVGVAQHDARAGEWVIVDVSALHGFAAKVLVAI